MTNRRRAFIIFFSVLAGTILSAGMIYLKRGSFQDGDMFFLATNLFFSILIIAGIGFMFVWNNKKKKS
jgi:hypothetical protein